MVVSVVFQWSMNWSELSEADVFWFCKKGVLRNFARFTGKHLSQSLFFNKIRDSGNIIEVAFVKEESVKLKTSCVLIFQKMWKERARMPNKIIKLIELHVVVKDLISCQKLEQLGGLPLTFVDIRKMIKPKCEIIFLAVLKMMHLKICAS